MRMRKRVMSSYIDNIKMKFSDVLNSELNYFDKADFCVGYFTLAGGLKTKYSPTKPIHSKVYIIRKDSNLIALSIKVYE